MKIGAAIGNVLKIALLGACIYVFIKWDFTDSRNDEGSGFAEHACVTEIRGRFDVTSAKAYSVERNEKGYVVHATMTLARGTPAKVICLCNEHGGVEEIRVEER